MLADVDRASKRGEDPLRVPNDLGLVGRTITQHEELVAPEPGNGVMRPHRTAKAIRHLDQDLVADGVSEAVIDELEAVEIHHEQRDRSSPSAGVSHGLRRAVQQERAVGEIGECVVEGMMGDFRLCSVALHGQGGKPCPQSSDLDLVGRGSPGCRRKKEDATERPSG